MQHHPNHGVHPLLHATSAGQRLPRHVHDRSELRPDQSTHHEDQFLVVGFPDMYGQQVLPRLEDERHGRQRKTAGFQRWYMKSTN